MKSISDNTIESIFRRFTLKTIAQLSSFTFVIVGVVLTIAFTEREQAKLEAITNQLAAHVKPMIQIGNEIEIRGIVSKILETSDALLIDISGKSFRRITSASSRSDLNSENLGTSSYIDIFSKSYIVQQATFQIYPETTDRFTITVAFPNTVRLEILKYSFVTTFVVSLLLLALFYFGLKAITRRLSDGLRNLRNYIERFDSTNSKEMTGVDDIAETQIIKQKFDSLQERINQQQIEILKKSVEEERSKIASQLGHDLKSYSSILLTMIQNLKSKMSEEDLLVFQRVTNEIATKMTQLQRIGSRNISTNRSVVLQIAPFISHLVEMKSIEYAHLENVKIYFEFNVDSLSCFAKIDPLELGTAISNLVNNSVESIEGQGEVRLSVQQSGNQVSIVVRDNGCGIPEDRIDQITKFGFSTKKGVDRGKGLTKALQIVEEMGGRVAISSTAGVGTSISLNFLKELPRSCFVKELNLASIDRAIIVDNDPTFLGRLTRFLKQKKPELNFVTHSSFNSFKSWATSEKVTSSDLILMDYDLQESDSNKTGFDLITTFAIENQSVLITHSYQDARLLDACDEKRIKLLPKNVIEKINFVSDRNVSESIKGCDGYVIEDNTLHVLNIRKAAESKNLNLRFYRTASDFLHDSHELDRTKPVLIDSQLENDELGELHAKMFYDDLGFKKIFLNTGYDLQHFENLYPGRMYWIEKIVNKDLNVLMECFHQ